MASNKQIILDRYSNKSEEFRATQTRADGLEFYFTKRIIDQYISKDFDVVEIGCGTGYYGMYCSNICKNYVGIDISPENIDVFNEKIKTENIRNIETIIGDITNLDIIKNNNFDLVMVLGPMYHLPPEERELAFKEAERICKTNGIIIFAYINKLGAYLQSGILSFPDNYPNKMANESVLTKGIDDDFPGFFYYTTPIEIEKMAIKHGLNKIKNVGVNFVFN